MKIKAKYGVENVIIIAFVPAHGNCVKAIFVRDDGKIGSSYVDNGLLTVTDENYIQQRR